MKTSDKDIKRLTRSLLKEGMAEPSSDLSRLIMERIMQESPLEVPVINKAKSRFDISPYMIFGILIAYLLLFVGLILFLNQQPDSIESALHGIKEKLPYLLTLATIAGSLIFYTTLDKIVTLRF